VHIQDVRANRNKTGFSHHIPSTGHAYDTLENTMKILNYQEKGQYLNTLERFHIHKTNKTGRLLNDKNIHVYNPVFEAIC
jgi:hypothetical protein